MKSLDSADFVSSNQYIPQILKESKLLVELEGELNKKRALYNNPILAGHKKWVGFRRDFNGEYQIHKQ